jgi:hypothetical protein
VAPEENGPARVVMAAPEEKNLKKKDPMVVVLGFELWSL